ncbi:ThiF family adenylyltransferase [Amycolatopsis sp.]|jgi:hypothetical protein|uniref:ThiF family adenylyltransferase n=1 Tax=Amycolatopsis sp. TaxID=37632 RepID=UPI002625A185|nr:ThiF family adenylyltransferase [Amycolatopsis sp.]
MTPPPADVAEVMLPARPQLLPGLSVLDRGPDEVQIGLDPRHAVVAGGLPPAVIAALHRLDGSTRIHTLLDLAESEQAEQLRELLTELAGRGLIKEAEPQKHDNHPEPGFWSLHTGRHPAETASLRGLSTVVVHGDGRLGVAVATQLATAGVGHVETRALGRVTEHDLGSGYLEADIGLTRRKAAAEAVRRVNPATMTGRLHGSTRPGLVLLTDAVVPAPEVVNDLFHDGIPHLPARVRDGVGIVGPLVLPGRTSCLRCADLHRTSLDSCWPRVAGQLAGRTQPADLGDIQACAALAVAQALRVLTPGDRPPPVWNTTLEIDFYAAKVRRRPWPPHPRCRCGAR